MTRKSALRTDAQPLQRGCPVPVGAIARGDILGGLVDSLHHLVRILERGELGRHDAEHDVFIRGQVFERREAAGARRVVLEVEGVDVERGEHGLGDAVVGAFAEVLGAEVVAAAEVDAQVHVLGSLDGSKSAVWAARGAGVTDFKAGVVEAHVGAELFVGALEVFRVGGPAGEHGFRAEVCGGG